MCDNNFVNCYFSIDVMSKKDIVLSIFLINILHTFQQEISFSVSWSFVLNLVIQYQLRDIQNKYIIIFYIQNVFDDHKMKIHNMLRIVYYFHLYFQFGQMQFPIMGSLHFWVVLNSNLNLQNDKSKPPSFEIPPSCLSYKMKATCVYIRAV